MEATEIKEGVTVLANDRIQIILSEYNAILLKEFIERIYDLSNNRLDIIQRIASGVIHDSLKVRFNHNHLEDCKRLQDYINKSILEIMTVKPGIEKLTMDLTEVIERL